MTVPNLWEQPEHATSYLSRADRLPHRREGEDILARDLSEVLPGRILDLGCGDGRLTAILLEAYPESAALCVDMSTTMLAAASARFGSDERVTLLQRNLDLVASPTRALHEKWRTEMDAADDPSDILCDLPSQLGWLCAVGLQDVDCIWKWRSLALMRGQKPLRA